MNPEVWEKVDASVKFLRKIKTEVTKKDVLTEISNTTLKKHEIFFCRPDSENKICFNDCTRGPANSQEKFFWCFTSSKLSNSDWDVCQCRIRPEILEWLKLTKKQLMDTTKKPVKVETDLVQWILIGIFGFVVLIISGSIIGLWIYKFRKQSVNLDN